MIEEATDVYFLESSAWIKLFFAERGSPEMVGLVERTADGRKYVSPLVLVESRSAIRRRERAGEISADQAEYTTHLVADEMRRVIQQPINAVTLQRCESVIDAHALRTLDAIQLATALLASESLPDAGDAYFVCCDHKLLKAAEAEGLKTWNPEDN